MEKYGVCNSILIRDILGNESAILIQNAFPTLEKYIDHVYVLENGKPAKVISSTCDEILENFKEFLNHKVKIHKRIRKTDNRIYYKICFKNQDIVDYLNSYGITPNKTFTIKLSYINWNVLRGIFDGDGTLTEDIRKTHSWKFSICSASLEFINQINDFYVSNGLHPLVYKQRNYYTIHLGRLEEIYYVYSNIYKDSSYFLKRKYDKFCPLVEKFIRKYSVNSVKERENY